MCTACLLISVYLQQENLVLRSFGVTPMSFVIYAQSVTDNFAPILF
jgi:hypothetical protein